MNEWEWSGKFWIENKYLFNKFIINLIGIPNNNYYLPTETIIYNYVMPMHIYIYKYSWVWVVGSFDCALVHRTYVRSNYFEFKGT